MKVLVTGSTGFVGAWLVQSLLKKGLEVRTLVRNPKGPFDFPAQACEVVQGDVTNFESLLSATQQVHSVFHLAGHIGYSRKERPQMELVNVKGTQNIVEACLKNKVQKLLHMSSVVAIGSSFDGVPLNETSPYNMRHLNLGYWETKNAAENYVLDAVKNRGLHAVCVNPSTIYGAGDAKKGSRKTQLKVAQGKMPFYTSGGVNVVSIEDVIFGILSAWEKGGLGERYILSGENILIRQLFSEIANCAGVSAPNIKLPNPVVKIMGQIGDLLEPLNKKFPLNSEAAWSAILFHWYDNSKAVKELGLKPRPAKVAIQESVQWIKEQGLLNI